MILNKDEIKIHGTSLTQTKEAITSHTVLHVALSILLLANLVINLFKIGLDTNYWTAVNHFFIWGSLAVYFAILFAMQSDGLFNIFPNQFTFIGTSRNSLDQPVVWLVIFLTTVVCIMPMVAVRFIKTDCYPTQTDKVRLLQQATRRQGPQEQNLRRVRRTSSRRSAYAFAHQQGYGELITSGKNMKVTTSSTSTCPLSSPEGRPGTRGAPDETTTEVETNNTGFKREFDQNQDMMVEDLEAR